MANLWVVAASYDDFDYSNPSPEPERKPGVPGHDEGMEDKPMGCGFMRPEQERAVAHKIAHEMNYDDLGNGKKGWYCHDCSHANGFENFGGHDVDIAPHLPEPDYNHPDWYEQHKQKYREATPAEKIAKGAVYHTSTGEGLRVGKPQDHQGCYETTDAWRQERWGHTTDDHRDPQWPDDYDVEQARIHPHVGVQYGHEHHPVGHRMHQAEALYGIHPKDGGLELWAN
jgi:hypothetical protein